MASVIHVYHPTETIEYSDQTGNVVLTRQYQVEGALPTDVLALAYGTGAANIPYFVDVSISYVTRFGSPLNQTVTCCAKSRKVTGVVQSSTAAKQLTQVEVIYEGLVTGVFYDELEISTKSELLVVDLDIAGIDIFGRPRGIGSKTEGINRLVGAGTWKIYENIGITRWKEKVVNIISLTGAVNEKSWKPTVANVSFYEGQWLYLGATFAPVGLEYYQLCHSFDMAITISETQFHKYPWRQYEDFTTDADMGDGTTKKRTERRYGPEVVAQIYPVAGKNNVIEGLDLRAFEFANLEL